MNRTLTAPEQTRVSDAGFRPFGRRRLSVLLFCDDQRGHANTVLDHITALVNCAEHEVRVFNPCGMTRSRYLDLNEFDAVVIHYSLVIISDHYLAPTFREQIRRFTGLKVQFIQDEYRWVDEITAMMRYLGIHLLFTLLSPSEIPKVYPESRLPGVIKLTTLAGYVPDSLVGLSTPPLERRPLDIGYRGRVLPYWLGRLAQEKVWVAQGVLSRADKYNLRCNIAWAEQDRIYGQPWNQFLMSCRATLGTESGASITDFDGSIERRTKAYLAEHPSASFDELHGKILAPYEDNARVTAISPRIFEAAALRTAMILFPGEYSGLVQPWVHYIPLAKDFSNMDEVVERLRDVEFLRNMTERAYQDLVASARYSQGMLAREFAQVVSRYGTPSGKRQKLCYQLASLEQPCAVAVQKARAFAQPILRVPHDLVKGAIALMLLSQAEAGRRILRTYFRDVGTRKTMPFRQLLTDILKLAVVGQARGGARTDRGLFSVRIHFDPERGRLIFESQPVGGLEISRAVCRAPEDALWADLAAAVRERRVRRIVWNHSAMGGNVRYRLASIAGLTVCVGDYDLHSFEGFVQVARWAPESASSVLLSLLGANPSGRGSRSEACSSQ